MDLLARLKITANGKLYSTEERSTEIDLGGADNKPVVDAAGGTHSIEEMTPGMLKTTMLVGRDLNIREIQEIKDGTIIAEGNNGMNFILRNAWCGNARAIKGGKLDVTFYGNMEQI